MNLQKNRELKWYFEQGKSGVEHAILPEAGVVTAGECIIGADSHTCTYGALGAFSTGMGTTDIATGMATGEIWFKVPAAIQFVLTGKPGKYVSGKDIIIHIIGKIGVDGALTNPWSLPETELHICLWMTVLPWRTWRLKQVRRTESSRWMKRQKHIRRAFEKEYQISRQMRMQIMNRL